MPDAATPVVFLHGLWLHATSWASWSELFSEAGYDPIAPGWPGDPDTVEAARANPDSIADHGIDDVTARYQAIIDGLAARPILIGHSFGGMIAEKLLGQGRAAAASNNSRPGEGIAHCSKRRLDSSSGTALPKP